MPLFCLLPPPATGFRAPPIFLRYSYRCATKHQSRTRRSATKLRQPASFEAARSSPFLSFGAGNLRGPRDPKPRAVARPSQGQAGGLLRSAENLVDAAQDAGSQRRWHAGASVSCYCRQLRGGPQEKLLGFAHARGICPCEHRAQGWAGLQGQQAHDAPLAAGPCCVSDMSLDGTRIMYLAHLAWMAALFLPGVARGRDPSRSSHPVTQKCKYTANNSPPSSSDTPTQHQTESSKTINHAESLRCVATSCSQRRQSPGAAAGGLRRILQKHQTCR